MKKILSTLLIAVVGGAGALFIQQQFFPNGNEQAFTTRTINNTPVRFTSAGPMANMPEFVAAAEASVNAVVHITTESEESQVTYDPFHQYFFGQPQQPRKQQGSGSGVIIDKEGYIVTNNHVI